MYKSYKILALLVLFLIPFTYAQQQTEDTIRKIMDSAENDISEKVNQNMDDNFLELDKRMNKIWRTMYVKAIIGISGIVAVVVFGYAYVNNIILKRYDIHFYEKLIDSKLQSLTASTHQIIEKGSFYRSVLKEQFPKKFKSDPKYFTGSMDYETEKSYQSRIKLLEQDLEHYKKEQFKKDHPKFYNPLFQKRPSIFSRLKSGINRPFRKKE